MHALSFVRDEEEVKDIVTDVYEYVWMNFGKWYTSISLRPLLYKLTRSLAVDFLRKEKAKGKFLASRELLATEEEEYEDYEELIGKVMRVIENMPEQKAKMFRKCFIERKKYQEAGDELNISINTVRWHINKAMKLLRGHQSGEDLVLFYFLFS